MCSKLLCWQCVFPPAGPSCLPCWWAPAGVSEAEPLFVLLRRHDNLKEHGWDFVSVDNIVNSLLLFFLGFLLVKIDGFSKSNVGDKPEVNVAEIPGQAAFSLCPVLACSSPWVMFVALPAQSLLIKSNNVTFPKWTDITSDYKRHKRRS